MLKSVRFGLFGFGLASLGVLAACQSSGSVPAATPVATLPASPTAIVALGRIVPEGDVIKLSVPNAQDSRVNRILVREGDRVQANQVIAILQGSDRRRADIRAAEANIRLLQAKLTKAQQGDSKPAAITAQTATIERLKAQRHSETLQRQAAIASAQAILADAELTLQRRQDLNAAGALERDKVDTARRDRETARAALVQRQAELQQSQTTLAAQIREAEANLKALRQVLPVDVAIAEAELQRALVELEQRRADLEDTEVRAPIPGQILRINTRVGEQVNTQQGIVELAQTNRMYVLTEVYETEIRHVRPGQIARIRSEAGGVREELRGQVDQVGLKIGKRSLSDGSNNPTTDENTRIVEVKVRIAPQDSPRVAGLTNLQVRVTIEL